MNNAQLNTLKEFIKIKSVSTQNAYLPDMKAARTFLVNLFKGLGFKTKILKGEKHDAVFAERIADPEFLTVLIYGHYDVQPPEPLEQWKSPPFTPSVKNGRLFARGADDNKGQIMVHIMAVKKILEKKQKINLNFKFIIEGEEEIGSTSVEDMVKRYGSNLLKADLILVSDSEMVAPKTPTITSSLRGIVYPEVFLEAAKQDLHSGQYGGVALNAASVLIDILSRLKDRNNRILIPGFYDAVVLPGKKELKDFGKIRITNKSLKREGGFFAIGGGEEKYSLSERMWARPTLDVNGITTGYQGEGSKTIIPAKASAKLSMRIVPNQNPQKIYKLFVKYVKSLVPKGIKVKIINHAGSWPYKAPTGEPEFDIIKACLSKAFGKKAVFAGMGGSIGFVPVMAGALRIPCILVGFGLPDDNLHAPNESFPLFNYFKGIEAMEDFYLSAANKNK